MDDTTLFELIPDYTLGVLSDTERQDVEALLARSEEARILLAEYEATLGGLAILTTPYQKAPASLTSAFAERLNKESEAPRVLPVRRRTGRWSALGMVAAALILLTASLLSVTGVLNNLTVVHPTATPDASAFDRVMADPNTVRMPVVFTDGSHAVGTLIMNRANTDAILEVSQMIVPPSGNQYQVWLIDNAGPKSAGVFTVTTPTALTRHLVRGQLALSNYTMVAITIEPNGGSSAPTSPPIAAVVF